MMRSGLSRRRRADQGSQIGDVLFGAKIDAIRRGALKFAGVLQNAAPLVKLRPFGPQRICQRGLAGTGAASDQDIAAVDDCTFENARLLGDKNVVDDVIVQRINPGGGFADRKARRHRYRRQQAFEAFAALRQFGADDRIAAMHFQPDMRRNQPDDALHIGRTKAHGGVDPPLSQPVEPERTIRIDHHFDDGRIGKCGGDFHTHRGAQHGAAAFQR